MRIWPVFEVVLVCVVFGLFMWPIVSLTGESIGRVDQQVLLDEKKKVSCFFTWKSSHPVGELKFFQNEECLWKGEDEEGEFDIVFVNGEAEIMIEVKWTEMAENQALELELEPDFSEIKSLTIWGAKKARDSILLREAGYEK